MIHAVFEHTSLAGIQLKNRIIRSATHEGMADEKGLPTDKLRRLYIRLAKGDVGAIITGYAAVQADGKSSLFAMTMIDSDDSISTYKKITDAVHEYGTPIIMQVAHCGRQTRLKSTGFPTVAPSALRDKFFSEDTPKELSEGQIDEIIDNFVSAVIRTQKAGFDGVQLHLAHGYLLSEFLSSYSNRRKDRWGGTIENKYRIIGEIFKRAKERVGDYPILGKMNAHDGRKNGMRIQEAVQIAQMLENSGCAAIEVSCGVLEDGFYTMRGEKLPADAAMEYTFKFKNLPRLAKAIAKPIVKTLMKQPKPLLKYNLEAAVQIKMAVNIPVIVVGGINKMEDINCIIENNNIDFVSMSRPFIIEPDIVNKFSKGIQTKSKCIMCNYCAIIAEEEPLKCHYGRLPKQQKQN
jgi:2,4-dienoyl-CoA reductase-like NADH-dependent reductase (Old Yellow Enzyme family)